MGWCFFVAFKWGNLVGFSPNWFLKANVTILDLSCNLPGSGIPEPGAVPGIPGTVCSEHVYLSS